MTASPITLLEGGLVFDRTGQTLVAAEPDAVSIIELGETGQTTRLPIRDARALAAFVDQLWIATHDDQLLRVDHAGRALGPPWPLPFAARAVLEPAPCGPAAAIWSSIPAVALIDQFGQLGSIELADAELALPLTGRRFVTVRGTKLTLPSGRVTTLAPGTSVLGGAVMLDGRSVVLVVAHGGGRQLIVVSLDTAQVTRCHATPSSTLRIATRRSLALALLEPRVIWVFDLRAGCDLGTISLHDDVDDFAIDPDGRTLAVRHGNGAIELHQLDDLLWRPPAVARAVFECSALHMRSGPAARHAGWPEGWSATSPSVPTEIGDDEPTLNIRRPRPRPDPGPQKTDPVVPVVPVVPESEDDLARRSSVLERRNRPG